MKPITGTNGAPVIGCGKVTIDEDGILIGAKLDGNPLCEDLETKIVEAIENGGSGVCSMSNQEAAGRGIPSEAPSVARNVRLSYTKRQTDLLVISASMFALGFLAGWAV